MRRIVNALGKLNWGKRAFGVLALYAATAIASPAQTFTSLASFDGTNGANPTSSLVQATDGNLYGTTQFGGAYEDECNGSYGIPGCGTVFQITPGGTLTTMYNFDGTDGAWPGAGLVLATDGNLYGTTEYGGDNETGTVFKITLRGMLSSLYSFTDEGQPLDLLIQATDGNFYGTAASGGHYYGGSVFRITPGATFTTLYSFCSQGPKVCPDGKLPTAALVQATDGNFYGTTDWGGASAYCTLVTGCGTVFRITPGGMLTTLYSFCTQANCPDGARPYGGLVQASDGNFYGTTDTDGANGAGGTVFKITPSGTLTTLYSFCSEANCADGSNPYASLVRATDGNFYGTTYGGGAYSSGTVFKITPAGALTTLYSFCPQA